MLQNVSYGLCAGGIGAIIANPLDLTLVRMQADAKRPIVERRNYKNVFEGVYRITRQEGLLTLWKGSSPTCARAMVITASQFAVYDKIKTLILEKGILPEGKPAHFCAALLAGMVASFTFKSI